jgi:predicted phage-related endonuclease
LTPPDFEDNYNPHTAAGNKLEPIIREEYVRRTGREVTVPENSITSSESPFMLVHVDGIVHDPFEYDEPGVLEIKSLADWSWNTFMNEGLYIGYQYQLQHAMYVTGLKWGAFAIHHRTMMEDQQSEWTGAPLIRPSDYEIKFWDVQADLAVQEMLVSAATAFWKEREVKSPPPALPLEDPRCKQCRWRETCRLPEQEEAIRKDIVRCRRLATLYKNKTAKLEEQLVTIQGLC